MSLKTFIFYRRCHMTRIELAAYFREHHVPAKFYSLKENGKNGRICLSREGSGWDVYYKEHEAKIGALHFATEAEALAGLKTEVSKMVQALA